VSGARQQAAADLLGRATLLRAGRAADYCSGIKKGAHRCAPYRRQADRPAISPRV